MTCDELNPSRDVSNEMALLEHIMKLYGSQAMPVLGGIFKVIQNLKDKCIEAVHFKEECAKIEQWHLAP